MSERPDHELEELEADSSVPPRPEEEVADAERASSPAGETPDPRVEPASGGVDDSTPAQGEGSPDSH